MVIMTYNLMVSQNTIVALLIILTTSEVGCKKTHGMRLVLPEMGNLQICRMLPRRQLRQSLEVRAEDSRGGQGQVGGLPGAGAEERILKISRRIMNYLKALEQERRDNLKRAVPNNIRAFYHVLISIEETILTFKTM